MALCKTIVRTAVIGGLVTGGLVLIAGPERVSMLAGQARDTIVSAIDDSIDDPVALRNQLSELEREYPNRIAELEGELASLDQQIAELQRDKAVADHVVELAGADLKDLQGMLEEAQAAREVSPGAVIRVHWQGAPISYDRAITRAAEIRTTYNAYATRASEAVDTLTVLSQQRERMTDLLSELRAEHEEFRAQIVQLDGQIAAIERNDRLIEMVERRERAIREYDKSETVSLDQVKSKLAKTRAEQEARLQQALRGQRSDDYAAEAEEMLNREAAAQRMLDEVLEAPVAPERVDVLPPKAPDAPKPMASAEREEIVIE